MKKTNLVVQRLWQMLPVLLGVSVIAFALAQAIPGDPIRLILGPRASEATIAALRDRYGLDEPILVQYFVYFGNLLQGDWGQSIAFRTPVLDLVTSRLEPTAWLIVGGVVISAVLALVLAVIASARQDRWPDQGIRVFYTVGLGLPAFWIGLMFVLIFAVNLGWLPATGFGEGLVDHLHHLTLPWLTVAIVMTPIIVRNLRATLLERKNADFVTAARAKGLSERAVFVRHVLPNSVVPSLHLLGVVAIYVLGISIIVEPIFAIPGLGALFISSIVSRDYFVIQGLTLVFALFTIVVTLLVDLLTVAIDPRIEA